VFHDVKVYPDLTTLEELGSATVAPTAPLNVVSEPLPPLAEKLTVVLATTVHCA
jgi:hypothetical protein